MFDGDKSRGVFFRELEEYSVNDIVHTSLPPCAYCISPCITILKARLVILYCERYLRHIINLIGKKKMLTKPANLLY